MTTPWPDEADLPPDRPVETVHLPEGTEMPYRCDNEDPHDAHPVVLRQSFDEIGEDVSGTVCVGLGEPCCPGPRCDCKQSGDGPATPPEIPAAALTPPGGDTTLDEAPAVASDELVHFLAAEYCRAIVKQAAYCQQLFIHGKTYVSFSDAARVIARHVAADREVFTARHAAEVAQLREDLAESQAGRASLVSAREVLEQAVREQAVAFLAAQDGLREAHLGQRESELATAEQRGRERAAQAILAAGRDPLQNLSWMYPEQAADLARGATPIPAGGEAKEPYWTGYEHALAHLIGYRSGAGWGPTESAEVQADADTWAAALDGAIDTLSQVLRGRWIDAVAPAQQLRDLLGEGSPFTAMLAGGKSEPLTFDRAGYFVFDLNHVPAGAARVKCNVCHEAVRVGNGYPVSEIVQVIAEHACAAAPPAEEPGDVSDWIKFSSLGDGRWSWFCVATVCKLSPYGPNYGSEAEARGGAAAHVAELHAPAEEPAPAGAPVEDFGPYGEDADEVRALSRIINAIPLAKKRLMLWMGCDAIHQVLLAVRADYGDAEVPADSDDATKHRIAAAAGYSATGAMSALMVRLVCGALHEIRSPSVDPEAGAATLGDVCGAAAYMLRGSTDSPPAPTSGKAETDG